MKHSESFAVCSIYRIFFLLKNTVLRDGVHFCCFIDTVPVEMAFDMEWWQHLYDDICNTENTDNIDNIDNNMDNSRILDCFCFSEIGFFFYFFAKKIFSIYILLNDWI